jgi:hypothetical protein
MIKIAIDGWSNPQNLSIWSFVIYTPDHKQYLYELRDLSSEAHTAQYIATQIEEIMNKVGPSRFSAVVSDGASNMSGARKIVTNKFKHIINLRCIAHCINLVTKDIIKHNFAKSLISKCKIIVKFFKRSHRATNILLENINKNNIVGGGLKKYCKTRWTSVYDTVASIIRLKPCFDLVSVTLITIF